MPYSSTAVEAAANWVRLRIGDTDTLDVQLTDDEIESLINLSGSKVRAAAAAANMLAAKYTRFGAMKEAESYAALALTISAEEPPSYL